MNDRQKNGQSLSVFFKQFNHANTLFLMPESPRAQPVECALAIMSKRRVAKIMTKSNRLCQILI